MAKTAIPAIRFEQNGIHMYLSAPTMDRLHRACKVDVWDSTLEKPDVPESEIATKQGYQRRLSPARVKKIAKYALHSRAIFPTSVLISVRGKVKFTQNDESMNFGVLEIPEEAKLFIIDGQHRFEGLRYGIMDMEVEELLQFPLPCTILPNLSKVEEIRQFVLVNTTQKRVSTSLADRLLERLGRTGDNPQIPALQQMDWKSRAVRLASKLNDDPTSPWHGRIIRPNENKGEFAVAGESEFTKSLRHLLASDIGRELLDDEAYEVINDFWKAIRSIMPKAFAEPSKYVIQKTPGFHSWNKILPSVLYECDVESHRDRSVESLKKILKRVDPDKLEETWWLSGNDGAASFVGMGPIGDLADEMLDDVKPGRSSVERKRKLSRSRA